MAEETPLIRGEPKHPVVSRFLSTSITALKASVWLSACCFGVYILCFYFGALLTNVMWQWNTILPLLKENAHVSNGSMGAHFLGGGLLLVMGSIQFIGNGRPRWPRFHRLIGRLYVFASFVTAFGGLGFIILRGTIGGVVMSFAFSLYGIMMLVSAAFVAYYAKTMQFATHREWAVRLYALAIGSWMYRLEYGFWIAVTGGLGMTPDYRGPFDYLMDFFFFVPTVLVAELVLRLRKLGIKSIALKMLLASFFWCVTFLVGVSTFHAMKASWIPGILVGLKLRPYSSLDFLFASVCSNPNPNIVNNTNRACNLK